MSCKIKIKKYKNIPILKIIGQVTASSIHTLSQKLESLAKSKHHTIVVDLNETNYIDSHGLGVFVYAWKMMEENNHELVFLNPQGFIRDIFEGTNLHQILKIIDNLEEI